MNPNKTNVPNIDEFVASKCTDNIRRVGTGGISIVYSSNGKRLTLNASILNQLSSPESVQIAYTDDFIAIANHIGETNTNYTLSRNGKSGVIYNAALIKEIINRYHLDFSSRTSMTFPVFEVQEKGDEKIFFINIKTPESMQDEGKLP